MVYKGRPDNKSLTGPNEAVRLATLLLNIYLIETKGQNWQASPHLPFPPAEAGRKIIPCSIDKLSWNCQRKFEKTVIIYGTTTIVKTKLCRSEILDLVNRY